MENHDRYLEVVWGCHYAGLVYTCASSRLQRAELEYIVNDCGARAYITSKYKADQAAEIVAATPNVELRLMLDGTIDGYESYEAAVAAQSPGAARRSPRRRPRHALLLGHDRECRRASPGSSRTSRWRRSTTGSPGCCQLLFGVDDTKRYLSPAPFYHAAPLRFCMSMHALGATIVAMENFDAEQYLRLVDEYDITHSQVVPTMFVRMLKLRRGDPCQVRRVVAGVRDPCRGAVPGADEAGDDRMVRSGDPRVLRRQRRQRIRLLQQREVARPSRARSALPIDCVLHIVGEDGEEVPQGRVRAPCYFEGGAEFEYHNDPEKTKGSRHPKGWSTLGDVGYLDEDGFLYLTDRKAYMIISGGVNIYPQEAENVWSPTTKVIDVAVFGVPNDDFGEEVKAVVHPREMPADEEAAQTLACGTDPVLPKPDSPT